MNAVLQALATFKATLVAITTAQPPLDHDTQVALIGAAIQAYAAALVAAEKPTA